MLQAHNHNYQRSYPIEYNLEASSKPFITNTNRRNYADPMGQIYVTVGTGGAALHDLNGKAPFVAAQYKGFGFLDISITSNGRNLTGIFYDNSGGLIKDSFYYSQMKKDSYYYFCCWITIDDLSFYLQR